MAERKDWRQVRRARIGDPQAAAGYERARRSYEFAEQVRALRVRAGISQSELARRIGTTQSAVARLEGGGVFPTIATLERVAEALGAELVVRLRSRRRKSA